MFSYSSNSWKSNIAFNVSSKSIRLSSTFSELYLEKIYFAGSLKFRSWYILCFQDKKGNTCLTR